MIAAAPETHVLRQSLFRGAVLRERRRADRSNQPLALLLVTMGDALMAESERRAAVIAALSAARRETDLIGWFDERDTLGIVMPEVPRDDAEFVAQVEARFRRALASRMTRAALTDLTVQLHVHPGSNAVRVEQARPVDPLLRETHQATRTELVHAYAKRTLDLVGSLTLLAVLSPVFAVIAALVKLKSPGPVFFRQERIGQGMKPFMMLKFRTMRVNSDSSIHHQFVTSFIKSGAQAQEAGKNGMYKLTNDPRITSIGHLLRKTSLDELPQLLNVVRGEMSLVGPRPPLQYEVAQYEPWHCRRVLDAKPGITGLWQVKGRSRTTFDDMVRLDLRYAKAPSVWTDVKILMQTPAAVIAGKGAA